MIVPDVNLLLYAYDATARFHAPAAAWVRSCLSGSEPVGLPPVVVFAFLRVGTSARVFEHPMTPSEAADHVRAWLAQPGVQGLEPRADDLEPAAFFHTPDPAFRRLAALRWLNPLTGITRRAKSLA